MASHPPSVNDTRRRCHLPNRRGQIGTAMMAALYYLCCRPSCPVDIRLDCAKFAVRSPQPRVLQLCYQLPALLLPGITLVISPLMALMRDQVTALKAKGVAAAYIDSSVPWEEEKVRYLLCSRCWCCFVRDLV